jgi:hypothetical protein
VGAHASEPTRARSGTRPHGHSETESRGARQREKGTGRGLTEKTLTHLSKPTRTDLRKEANEVRKGEAKTRKELEQEATRLEIKGRSKMGKDELRKAISAAK